MRRENHRRAWLRAGAAAAALLLAVQAADAGAGRTRPGGRAGAKPSQQASGRATYGHRGHHGHHRHGHFHRHGYGGHHYLSPYYYGYFAWPWGWWYAGRPHVTVYGSYEHDPDAPGAVETDVSPKRADVLVDGEFVGQARDFNGRWDLLWLEPGPHVVEFTRDGYLTLRRHLEIRAGMHVRIDERLRKGEGLDPRSSKGPPPATARPPASAPSTATAELPARPSLDRGLLRLVVAPPDAAVYLDGEFLARASELSALRGALPVARGRHTVEVVRPGYASRSVDVEVGGEEPVRVEIALERR